MLTLKDYLEQENNKEQICELVNGEVVIMPPESERNRRIALFLLTCFLQKGLDFRQLTVTTEIAVSGQRATVRFPDLMVLSEELVNALEGATRSTITIDMPPPLLAVEVVSPGGENQARDYRYKRSEYAARGIAEYWIVDPAAEIVTVLTLVEGLYEEQVFEGANSVVSSNFPELGVTVNNVLRSQYS